MNSILFLFLSLYSMNTACKIMPFVSTNQSKFLTFTTQTISQPPIPILSFYDFKIISNRIIILSSPEYIDCVINYSKYDRLVHITILNASNCLQIINSFFLKLSPYFSNYTNLVTFNSIIINSNELAILISVS